MNISLLFLCFLIFLKGFSYASLVIVGGGPAGLTAAIYAGRFNLSPIVIEGTPLDEMPDYFVDNYPGFPEGIDRHELIERLRTHATLAGATFKKGFLVKGDFTAPPFQLMLSTEETLECEALILATGRSKNTLGVQGEKELFGKGVANCAFCEAPIYEGKDVIVIGNGPEALEQVSLLSDWAQSITLITQDPDLKAGAQYKNHKKVTYLLNTSILAIDDLTQGKVTGVWVEETPKNKRFIPCSGVFVALGSSPNTKFLEGVIPLDDQGYIKTEANRLQTLVPGVFAAGDVADPFLHQLILAAASGAKAAIESRTYLKTLCTSSY